MLAAVILAALGALISGTTPYLVAGTLLSITAPVWESIAIKIIEAAVDTASSEELKQIAAKIHPDLNTFVSNLLANPVQSTIKGAVERLHADLTLSMIKANADAAIKLQPGAVA